MTQRRWVFVILVLAGAQALLAATVPVAVSPGSAEGVTTIEARCPTFSWGAVEGANGYELVVYRLGQDGEETRPVVRQAFPGPVFGWTPSLDRCLEAGGRYAWTVRATGRKGASDWSAPSLFRVAPGPNEAEFEEAVEVVRSYLAARGEDAVSARREGSGSPQEEGRASGKPPAPLAPPAAPQLSVDGNIEATSFTGDGENLANVATDAELATHAGEANVHHTLPTSLPPRGAAGGDLAGIYPNPTVGPNVVGSAEITDGSVATGDLGFDPATQSELDTHAGAADVHHTLPTSLPPRGAAGGDLSSNYPNPRIAIDAVTSAKIDDGTITAADVNPATSIYVAKNQLYERDDTVTISLANASLDVTAVCDDANDLPLSGSCWVNDPSGGLEVHGFEAQDWASTASPAGWSCLFHNRTGGSYTGTARILCVNVPNPPK